MSTNTPSQYRPNYVDIYDDQKIIDFVKLAEDYNIKTINVRYRDYKNPDAYITIPINFDLFIRLKVWIAYNIPNDAIVLSPQIRGVENYAINTIVDDHNHKRLDITKYIYDFKKQ